MQPKKLFDVAKRTSFTYDYMGRRVKKTLSHYDKGAWVTDKELLFVYDGWNLIEEIAVENSNETSKYFVWGLDLSQSLQGAGGIGGLLATVDGSNIYFYLYDGNGNIMQLVNAGGETVASYEYSPFGGVIYQGGDYADSNVFRFSTKYFDVETGLCYYGFRFYNPELGRWMSRDPLGEGGGLSLYMFAYNNPYNWIDPFGLLDIALTPIFIYLAPGIAMIDSPFIPIGDAIAGGLIGLAYLHDTWPSELPAHLAENASDDSSQPNITPDGGGTCPSGDDQDPKNEDQRRAEHAKDFHSEWNNKSVDEVVEIMKDVRENGTAHRAGNGNVLYRKGKTIMIDNKFAADKGTMFIKNESPKKIENYIRVFLRQNR